MGTQYCLRSLTETIFKYLLNKVKFYNKMKFMLCNGPISIKTSNGKTLNVNWDVGKPDQTIKTMFDVSIKEDGCDGENTIPLSNKVATGPKFKKAVVWNGSSWMEVDQPEPVFQEANSRRKKPKSMVWNGSSWMEVNRVKPEFQKASFESEAYKANWNQLDEVEKKDIEMPVDEIIPLLYTRDNPCNNLQIKSLINMMVKSVALQIQGYPIEEIRKIFKVEDPKWTPEELEELEELQKIKFENAKLMSQRLLFQRQG